MSDRDTFEECAKRARDLANEGDPAATMWATLALGYATLAAVPPPAAPGLREALLHLAQRRHDHSDGCDGCLNVQRQVRAALAPALPTLDEAWSAAEAAVRRHKPGAGFGVEADGPGYRAHAGHEEWHGGYAEAWSVDDPELVGDPDTPSSPAKALLRLVAALAETPGEPDE